MNTWDSRYTDRVQLLVGILPVLACEPRFALKGGAAVSPHDGVMDSLVRPGSMRRRYRCSWPSWQRLSRGACRALPVVVVAANACQRCVSCL